MARTFMASDGIRLHYVIDDFTDPWKRADTLVLLHSAMSSALRLYPLVPTLARKFKVVRFDLRGHGQSDVPAPGSVLDMHRLVTDVIELLDELATDQVHLLGNSAGGYIAQHVAALHADRVKSLLLFGSTTGLKGTNATTWIPRAQKEGLRPFLTDTIDYRFDVDKTDPGLIAWFLDEVEKNDISYLARFIPLMTTIDTTDLLPNIKCPTLVAIPGREEKIGVRNYDALRELIPDVTVKDFPEVAHNMMDSMPDACADEALKFLEARFPPG